MLLAELHGESFHFPCYYTSTRQFVTVKTELRLFADTTSVVTGRHSSNDRHSNMVACHITPLPPILRDSSQESPIHTAAKRNRERLGSDGRPEQLYDSVQLEPKSRMGLQFMLH